MIFLLNVNLYTRHDCLGNEYTDITGKYTIKISFYYKDELIRTTNELYAHAFPIINTYDINLIETFNISKLWLNYILLH